MNELITLQEFGLPGIVIALLVLVAVFLAKRANLVITGNQARAANVILSAILAGLAETNGADEQAIVAAIASISSALIFELYTYVEKQLKPFPEHE